MMKCSKQYVLYLSQPFYNLKTFFANIANIYANSPRFNYRSHHLYFYIGAGIKNGVLRYKHQKIKIKCITLPGI